MARSRFFSAALMAQLAQLQAAAERAGWQVTLAESCTGGLLGGLLTEAPGASRMFGVSYVVYSNRAKMSELDVPRDVLKAHGAVSEACVLAMAEGALMRARADLALAVSGIAGPGGGTPHLPGGTVWLAAVRADGGAPATHRLMARGGRSAVREQTLAAAVTLMLAQFP